MLGAFEVGYKCNIGDNAVLLKRLESNVTGVGIPAKPVKKDGVRLPKLQKYASVEMLGDTTEKIAEVEEKVTRVEALVEKLSGGTAPSEAGRPSEEEQ